MKNWFATWFDSPYYHLLYQHRDYKEAQLFIKGLIDYLHLNNNSKALDLACGKGRHSIFLAKKGIEVTGVDLSPESIEYAKQFEHKKLYFRTHDMRQPIEFGKFDAVLNLFTSFGYFDTDEEHIETLIHMRDALRTYDSVVIIDFFNAQKIIANLVAEEEKTLDGITFNITRKHENGKIIKDIRFEDKGESFHFQESVRAFHLEDFKSMFKKAGLRLVDEFGDYNFSDYYAHKSNRLIMVLQH